MSLSDSNFSAKSTSATVWPSHFKMILWLLVIILAAVLSGLAALLFMIVEDYRLTHLVPFFLGQSSWLGIQLSAWSGAIIQAVWLIITLMLTCYLRDKYFQGTQGTGIPQVIAAIGQISKPTLIQRMLSFRIMIGKILLLILVMVGGMTVGREGPSVHVAACIMYLAATWFVNPSPTLLRGIIMAGAAIGIAAAFNTPIAAFIFCIEECAKRFDKSNVPVIVLSVWLGSGICVLLLGDYYFFKYVPHEWISSNVSSLSLFLKDSLWLLPLMFFMGFLGGAFARAVWVSTAWFGPRYSLAPFKYSFILAILVAALGLLSGGLSYGSGYTESLAILHAEQIFPWYYPFVKALGNFFALISGVPGGLFDPSFSVAAGAAQWLATSLSYASPKALILMFMVAYFTGVVQSPVTALVIVFEMTGAHDMIMPLGLTATVAYMGSRIICPKGLYDVLSEFFLKDCAK